MKPLLILLALAGAASAAQAQAPGQTSGPFLVQESGKSFYRLDDAVRSANGGDATIEIQPGTYRDCAVVDRGRVAFRARTTGSVIFDGGICEGKATLVLKGSDAMIDGLTFQNLHVGDGNGAGIRVEHGNLTVVNATFRNSDEGILTADDPAATIRVDRSTFSGLGLCAADCAHSIYIGHDARLIVTRSRFERGRGGHYVKSRSATVQITDNSFDDSQGHATNYMIDLPAGATGTIARNIFLQGRDKENHSAMVVVAAESRDNPSAGLAITANVASMAPGVSFPTSFVADLSHEPLKISGNTLGKGLKLFELR
jgi:hypothetical protein